MKIAVKDLLPNPFRHVDRYPINNEKVEALKASIESTGFWDNLLARATCDGQYELAYGHHRLTALRELDFKEIDIAIKELNDDDMFRIMANENMELYGHLASSQQETILALVEAFADGKIKLNAVDRATQFRIAPKFAVLQKYAGEAPTTPFAYTTETISAFLRWPIAKLKPILTALTVIEEELLTKDSYAKLNPTQAETVTREVRRVEKITLKETGDEQKAKVAAQAAGKNEIAKFEIKRTTDAISSSEAGDRKNKHVIVKEKLNKQAQNLITLNEFADKFVGKIVFTHNFKEKDIEHLEAMLQVINDINPNLVDNLIKELESTAAQMKKYARRFKEAKDKAKENKEISKMVQLISD